MRRMKPALVNQDHLARLNVAHVSRVNQIERAGLGSHNPRIAQLRKRERSKAARIPYGDQSFWRQKEHRERAFSFAQDFRDSLYDRRSARACDAMQYNFCIRWRKEDSAFALQTLSLFSCEWKITVVTDCDLSVLAGYQERLRFAYGDFTCG